MFKSPGQRYLRKWNKIAKEKTTKTVIKKLNRIKAVKNIKSIFSGNLVAVSDLDGRRPHGWPYGREESGLKILFA